MTDVKNLITDNIDIWTSAIKKRNATGRGSSKKIELTGIKKLRELILELAVRGKLVPQDANDEPASVLFEKIAAEKAQLIKDQVLKKPKALPEITDEEKPFELPTGWEWIKLGELGLTQTGGTPKKANQHHYGNFQPFIKPGDILEAEISSYDNDGLSKEGSETLGRIAPEDSVLMVCIGTIGKCARVNQAVSFNQQINSISPYQKIGSYLHKVLQSVYFQQYAWEASSSTTLPILNKGKWELIPVALAPLVEQHRIVAKVDELMALCDELEQQTEQSLSAHQTLVEVLLATLTQSANTNTADVGVKDGLEKSNEANTKGNVKGHVKDNTEDFQTCWQRIAEHFDVLFTTEASIEQLKQTILQLAVMGKLVPQNPSDEPASVLLEKIAQEKSQLIADKKIKKQKAHPKIINEDRLFELPSSWVWCRFGDICKLVTSGSRGWNRYYSEVGSTFIRSQDIKYDKVEFDNRTYVELPENSEGKRTKVELGNLLMTITGANVAKCAVVNIDLEDAYVSQHVALIKLIRQSINRFIHIWLTGSHGGRKQLLECSYGAKPGLNLQNINELLIPIPPVEEQHRIVAKVDELMAICDQLKTRLTDAQTTQVHLADAVVENALNE